jgi:diadenylate cyclase
MPDPRIKQQLVHLLAAAEALAEAMSAHAVMIVADFPLDWKAVRDYFPSETPLLLACPPKALPAEAKEANQDGNEVTLHGISWVELEDSNLPVHEQVTSAVLESLAHEYVRAGDSVIVLYPAFDSDVIDTLSVVHLEEHLERFTTADLRKLDAHIPLDTVKRVVDLALEIGREGREGKPVGTMFVIGDAATLRKYARPMGMDPFKAVPRKLRNLRDRRIREEVKELAQVDGAFLIDKDGCIIASRQWITAPAEGLSLSKGLGARHWAGAAISKATKALAITVSESTGTVRIFQNGQVVLRLEPLARRTFKWQDSEVETASERGRSRSKEGREGTESRGS